MAKSGMPASMISTKCHVLIVVIRTRSQEMDWSWPREDKAVTQDMSSIGSWGLFSMSYASNETVRDMRWSGCLLSLTVAMSSAKCNLGGWWLPVGWRDMSEALFSLLVCEPCKIYSRRFSP